MFCKNIVVINIWNTVILKDVAVMKSDIFLKNLPCTYYTFQPFSCLWFSPLSNLWRKYIYGIHHWRILWSCYRKLVYVLSGISTHDHWIPFRSSNQLNYQAISSTRTQSQLCTATTISSFLQCQVSVRSFSSSVATFVLIEIFLR